MLKQHFIWLAAALALTGCTTSVNPTYTATGNAGYRLVCGGVFGDGDMGSCYQKAGELCQTQGYRVLQTSVSSLIVECRDTPLPE
jgi:hypothetical protein